MDFGPEQFRKEAEEWIAEVSTRFSVNLDFSPQSLKLIDELIAKEWRSEDFQNAEFGDVKSAFGMLRTMYTLAIGSYLGEILVLHEGGVWRKNELGWVIDVGKLEVNTFAIAASAFTDGSCFEGYKKVKKGA